MDKNKKILLIGGIVEGVILAFCLTVAIIVLATLVRFDAATMTQEDWVNANMAHGPFIGTLQTNNVLFFCSICIPVFVLVALDFVYFFIIASKRETNLSDAQLEAIKKQAQEEARKEIEEELRKEKDEGK